MRFLEGCDFDRARALIRRIEGADTFEDLYEMLGFRYVLDPTGLMECLPRNKFRVAISAGVMEHIPAATAPRFVSNMASLLVAGGLGIHSINIADHLAAYDQSASPKQYLTYSELKWRLCYENSVQYINRIQRSQWLRMFTDAGFSVVEEGGSHADLTSLRIHPRYQGLSRKDIDCLNLLLVVMKPNASEQPSACPAAADPSMMQPAGHRG
jgi:2-polyprenyl-3-methyl-5-hydroxy-6-metoxy-1,4-benzoquinol methylase